MVSPTPYLIGKFAEHHYRQRQIGFAVGLVIWLGFYVWDIQLFGMRPAFEDLRAIRLILVPPVIATMGLLTFLQPCKHNDQLMSLLSSLAIGASWGGLLAMMNCNAPSVTMDLYIPGLLVVLIFHFTMQRLRWQFAAGVGITLLITFNFTVLAIQGQDAVSREFNISWFSANAYMASIILIGSLLCRQVEEAFYTTETQRLVLEEQKSVIESAKKDEQIAKVRAETAYQDRTNFLLQASHDLRQPMQAIKYFVSTLKDRSQEPGVLEIVHKLQRAVRSMDDLYNGLHDFNRIDADAIKADKVVCFLPLIIEEEVNNCMALAVEKGLALRVRIVHHAWIETDPHLARRILRNILSNALIYTQQGGVLVTLRKRGRMAHVQVFDTGEGIADHDLSAIFQPFVRMHPDRSHARRGLGLGLAIAEGLADKVGTRINVQSRPGRGSVFDFDLPMIHREVISLAAAFPFPDLVENSDRVPGGSMRHVALVDDDPEILEGCTALLTSAGYRVVSGRGGDELLASIRQSGAQPEILLSDIDLDTEEDAWQVHHQLQQHLGRTLPLMLITGSVTTASRERAERAAQTILQKPCDPEVLLHALDAALRTAT